jgi:branched-chain amino acid transport system permease protein
MDYFLGLLINGIVVGSIYSMIALGFVLIYKATEVVNFAQGELLMIGAYICLEVIVTTGMPFLAGFFTTLVFMTLLALAIEKLVLRRMMGAPVMSVVMATIGIGIVLRSVVLLVWGATNRPFPTVFPREGLDLGVVTVSQVYLYAFFLCLTFMVIFGAFFQYTRWGLTMRAVSSSRKAAESLGVPLVRVFALAWVISAIVSGVGGILAANISGLTPDLSAYGVRVFPAVILGGLDSIIGATISGVIIGVLENLSGGYLRNLTGLSGLGPVAPFFVLILILWVRPTGLFGRKEIDKL